MKLNKNSLESDVQADLYRSALYFARDIRNLGLGFYRKAKMTLKTKINYKPSLSKNNRYLAEKILDQYIKLKYS